MGMAHRKKKRIGTASQAPLSQEAAVEADPVDSERLISIGQDEGDDAADPPNFIPAAMPPGRSLLLDLPAELRNEIYKWATNDTALLSRRSKKLASDCCLAAVNKQVYQEFTGFLNYYATTIRAGVRRMDFSVVVHFLNRMEDGDFAKLRKKYGNSKRVFELVLLGGGRLDDLLLQRWVNRMTVPSKRGGEILFEYTSVKPGVISVDAIRDATDVFQEEKSEERKAELKKILQVMLDFRYQSFPMPQYYGYPYRLEPSSWYRQNGFVI